MTDPLVGLMEFVHDLRSAGAWVDTGRMADAAAALAAADPSGRRSPYWPMRVTLCSRREDLPVFDAVYAAWFGQPEETTSSWDGSAAVEAVAAGATSASSAAASSEAMAGASDIEFLAPRKIGPLTTSELAEIQALIPLLACAGRPRRSMRYEPARMGRIEVGGTVRMMLRNGGEPSRILYRRHTYRPRRLVMLIDVSRSMKAHSDRLLHFAYAAVAGGPGITEVFTLGTRWTRITEQLRASRPDTAMRAVARLESDWDGGTCLGPALRGFLRQWSGRDAVRSATVVIASDGVEFGDHSVLPQQVARLARLAHTLIWVNPRQARPGYIPLSPGLRTSLRYADEHLSGHSHDALCELAKVIAR